MNKWEEKRTRPVLPIYLAALVWPPYPRHP